MNPKEPSAFLYPHKQTLRSALCPPTVSPYSPIIAFIAFTRVKNGRNVSNAKKREPVRYLLPRLLYACIGIFLLILRNKTFTQYLYGYE